MTTKHKPATPLPFRAGTSGSHGLNKIIDADGHVVGEASSYSVHCFEQRDYLIHAANAYPKLIRRVNVFREWFADHFEDFSPEVNVQLLCMDNDAETLLRELGEDA